MKLKPQRAIIGCVSLLFLVLVYIWGWRQNVMLGFKLKGVDHIVATQARMSGPPVSITVTGAQMQTVIEAVVSARRDRGDYLQGFYQTVVFYKGTIIVGSILVGDGLFMIDGAQYHDTSGNMGKLICIPLYAAARMETEKQEAHDNPAPQ